MAHCHLWNLISVFQTLAGVLKGYALRGERLSGETRRLEGWQPASAEAWLDLRGLWWETRPWEHTIEALGIIWETFGTITTSHLFCLVLFCFKTGSSVSQAGHTLEVLTLLHAPPKCWGTRTVLPSTLGFMWYWVLNPWPCEC